MLTTPTALNDIHSRLNPTIVAQVERPQTLVELQAAIRRAAAGGQKVSVAGGRHAMGGQQFLPDSLHIDMTGLCRVLGGDPARGLLHIEAGADWPRIIAASHAIGPGGAAGWGIRQKQTGVDSVTLGGSIAANAHGRGLLMQPLGDDVADLTLVSADGEVLRCSRNRHAELFSLVIGGYGMFGVIYSATLRLAPRCRVKRIVDIIDLDDAMQAVYRRADEGCLYGDFQFVIDPHDERFLRRGVFACYLPSNHGDVAADTKDAGADLTPDTWLKLLRLVHDDKPTAFKLYAAHYLNTDGNHYWSDTMQLSTYLPSYADFLAGTDQGGRVQESLVIGEHYVPRARLLEFMQHAREVFRRLGTEVIYGTIRAILRDTVSFLPCAKDDFVCVIFNLRTPHTEAGRQKTAETFRALTDICIRLDGSFFLTYHRHALAAQVEACYPRFREWLSKKREYDPGELFCSSWYLHYRDAFAASKTAE